MSLALLREETLLNRRDEIRAIRCKRSSRLRCLNAVTAALAQHVGLPLSLRCDFASTPPTVEEERILDDNDLEKGRYLQDSSFQLSLDSIQQHAVPATPTARRPSVPIDTAKVNATPSSTTLEADAHLEPGAALKTQRAPLIAGPDPPSVEPADLKPHAATEHHAQTSDPRPEEKKEERLAERRLGKEQASRQAESEAEKSGPEVHAEQGSSPSSTMDAASTATPLPGDPSPATSAEDDVAVVDGPGMQLPAGVGLSVEERDARVQRAALLESQKQIARREARGTDNISPDVQLRLEEEQAVRARRDAITNSGANPSQEVTLVETPGPADLQVQPVDMSSSEDTITVQVPPAAPADSGNFAKPLKVDTTTVLPLQTAPAGPERMRTRVSSGAIRHRSVSEIISASPRNAPYGSHKAPQDMQSPGLVQSKPGAPVQKERRMPAPEPRHEAAKQTSAIAHVAETGPSTALSMNSDGYAALKGAAQDASRDYLEPLYRIQAQDPPNGRSLGELLHKASKAVSTSDQLACVHERQDHRILKRIYGLQYANHWSLRQMEPCAEPPVRKTHMDYLLEEMKWMRTDFRAERKIKKATAKYLAEQCAEWVDADEVGRRAMQTNTRSPAPFVKEANVSHQGSEMPHSPAITTHGNGDAYSEAESSPPDLESMTDDADGHSAGDGEMPATPQYATVPGSMFASANFNEDSLHLRESDNFVKAIDELPLYLPFAQYVRPSSAQGHSRKPQAVPAVSKYCTGKIVAKIAQLPRKRSRFDYDDGNVEPDEPSTKRLRASEEGSGVSPEQTDVALFDPQNKHIRDRLHANTAFRPPSEFPMPSTQFYEFRLASQWTWEDDQKLRRLARDYSFNWSLIANDMSLPSSLQSAAERRTPWECFERWVELETLPNEMRKTIYFKTWGSRLDTASRNVEARYQAQLQHHSQSAAQTQPPMRRRILPLRVEKRRQSRYLHVVDAMRKLARKREQQAHKQAEAQKAASLRKQHENAAPKSAMRTPQEFSRLRHERDLHIALQQERYKEQVLAQQKAAQMQRSGQAQLAPANAATQQRAGSANVPQQNNQQQPATQMRGPNGQVQSLPQQQQQNFPVSTRNGHLAVPQMGMQGNIPQAQMQANMRGAANNSTTSENMQRMAMQAQYSKNPQMQGQQYQSSPSPGVHGPNGVNNQLSNQAMIAAMQVATSNQAHAGVNGGAMQQNHGGHINAHPHALASPSMPPPPTPGSQPQQLSSGHVPAITQIKHSLQAQHPQATPQQIEHMAGEHMRKQLHSAQAQAQARQNALNAASGAHGGNITRGNQYTSNQVQQQYQQTQPSAPAGPNNYNAQAPNFPNGNSPSQQQQYSAMMRQRLMQQQAQLQSQTSPSLQHASPNMTHVSPNMQHAAPNMNGLAAMGGQQGGGGTPRPQMVRIPSSGGLTSPGMPQGSPRAGMVRQ